MTDNTTIDYAGADGFPMELPIPSTSLQRLMIDYMINSSSCLLYKISYIPIWLRKYDNEKAKSDK